MNLKGTELDDNIFRKQKKSSQSLCPLPPPSFAQTLEGGGYKWIKYRDAESGGERLSLLILCRSSAHVRRLLGDAGVAVVRGARVHHVAMMIGLHRLLRISLASHHAHLHLHGVLGWLVHVRWVTVVPAVHHGLWHSVASRHGSIERIHVHGVISGRGRHEVRHHATLHR